MDAYAVITCRSISLCKPFNGTSANGGCPGEGEPVNAYRKGMSDC